MDEITLNVIPWFVGAASETASVLLSAIPGGAATSTSALLGVFGFFAWFLMYLEI